MKKVLINLVHPNIDESRVNKFLSQTAQKEENVTVNNLYAKYPDFKIPSFITDSQEQNVAGKISNYATESIGEFIAEVYAKLIAGFPELHKLDKI